jgi:hypothetical protein
LPEDLAEADGWLSLALASELGLARLLDGALRRGDGATEAPREPVAKADESGLGPADKGRPAKRTRPDAKEASTLEWLIYALSLALGEGATQDLDEAVGLLRLVAERGEPRAWLALGLVLLKMNGLSVKPNEAVECLKAARASDSLEVGDCFRVLEAAVRAEEDGELARVWASLKLAEVDLSSIEPTEAVPKSTIGAKKPSSSKPGRARAGKAAKAGSVKEGQGRGD